MPDYKSFCIELVRRALNSSRELPRSFHRNASGTWLGDAVFQIAAVHDLEEPILYIGAIMTFPTDQDDVPRQAEEGYLGGTVYAFSKSTFYVSLTRGHELSTTAYPLALRSLEVTQVQGSYDSFNPQPYMIEVDAELSNGLAFQLPLAPNATAEAFDELQAALPVLRGALTLAGYEQRSLPSN